MDWSLLGCGARGHVTFAPEEPVLRERFGQATREGPAWRCLRCGTFVIGEPSFCGPAAAAPGVRRGKEIRSAFILRFFAVERFLRALVFGVLAVAVWRFSASRLSIEAAYDRELPALRALLRQLGFNVNHSKLLGLIQHAFTLNSRTLGYLAIGAAAYAVIEVIEGTGLWLLKRWGEYFAMVATSVGLPYEVYDLTAKVTVLRVAAFLINLALVAYLVVTKRLFGVRGGKRAYEARLRAESILQTEINALAAEGRRGALPAEVSVADQAGEHRQPAPAEVPVAGEHHQPAPAEVPVAGEHRQPAPAEVPVAGEAGEHRQPLPAVSETDVREETPVPDAAARSSRDHELRGGEPP